MSRLPQVTLRDLTLNDKNEFFKALDEEWESEFTFLHYWESLTNKNFEEYIKIVPEFTKGLHIPKEHVPCTFLFAFNSQNNIVGRISIRHSLTELLLQIGGHVGYGVVPSQRNKGYATAILKEAIHYIKNYLPELNKILVTCNTDNIGSKKTILSNGGVLENIVPTLGGKNKMRFWISI